MFQTSLSPEALRGALSRLRSGHSVFDRTDGRGASCHARQPIHTVYGGAHLFKADTARKLGAVALGALDEHAPDFAAFARALGLPGADELPERPAEALALAA
ncbi:MAG TPA: phosphoenolpyruvate kinase, partial [Sorangium sp.]|nr:phosphoenolpyruvate kinase [Sorangium sp.]